METMGKRTGRHPINELTTPAIARIKEPGRYADGGGLYLLVDDNGAKRWVLRFTVKGRRTDAGLGSLSVVPLAEARERARQYRKEAHDGGDPIAQRQKAREIPLFKDAAEIVWKMHSPTLKNPRDVKQWISSIRQYANPIIGDLRVDQIGTDDIQKTLEPIWLTVPETARRVRKRIGAVMDWAKTMKLRTEANPINEVRAGMGLPKQPKRGEGNHFPALPYAEMPQFIHDLRHAGGNEVARLALEFLILTAGRSDQVLRARRTEVMDGVWVIPAPRMKKDRHHRIPLPARCLEIIDLARTDYPDSEWLFPGGRTGGPLSPNMLGLVLERMKRTDITTHGFRSTFRDWSEEETDHGRTVAEQALAHVVKDSTEAAYRRGDLFRKRIALMNDWAKFCTPRPALRIAS
jgi:integrase